MLAEIHALSQTYIFLSKKYFVTGRNFLPQEDFLKKEEISCHRKNFLVTGKDFLSQEEEIYFTVKTYLPEEIVWPKTFLFD